MVYVAAALGLRHDGLPPTSLGRLLPAIIVMCAECADPNALGRYASPALYFYFMAWDDAAGVNLITPGARYRCSSSRPSIAHRRWGMGSTIILALNTRINHAWSDGCLVDVPQPSSSQPPAPLCSCSLHTHLSAASLNLHKHDFNATAGFEALLFHCKSSPGYRVLTRCLLVRSRRRQRMATQSRGATFFRSL